MSAQEDSVLASEARLKSKYDLTQSIRDYVEIILYPAEGESFYPSYRNIQKIIAAGKETFGRSDQIYTSLIDFNNKSSTNKSILCNIN